VKKPVAKAELVEGRGFKNDAHIDFGHRQVSLLMSEDIAAQKELFQASGVDSCKELKNRKIELGPGVFAENLTTSGIDLAGLRVGDELLLARKIRLRVSQVGKQCHTRCAVYKLVGECIMPARGIFCEVLDSGEVKVGDEIERR
jgi:MOSC domain-containing protein YiiM